MYSIRIIIGEVIIDILFVVSEDDIIVIVIDVMLWVFSEGVIVLCDGCVRGIFIECDFLIRVVVKGFNPIDVVVS